MDYYERYWKGELNTEKGSQNKPPDWNDDSAFRKIINLSKNLIKGNVLDAGCGDGNFLIRLKKLYPDLTYFGFDISAIAVELAKKNAPFAEIRQASFDDLSCYKDNFFDVIILSEVIEHLLDVELTLKELNRILKIDGLIIITTTDFNWLKKVLIAAFVFDKYFYPTNPHIRFFTKKTLQSVLEKNGFQVHKYNGTVVIFISCQKVKL